MLTMTDFTPEIIDPNRLVFQPVPRPSLADVRAIPDNSHAVVVSWPAEPPEIIGYVFDETAKESFIEMYGGDEGSRAGDVFIFYVNPARDEDDIVRRVLGLDSDASLADLDRAPAYSAKDVDEMVRVALRLHATPF